MIDDKLRQTIKARALDTFNGFEGGLDEMAQKAVSHAIKSRLTTRPLKGCRVSRDRFFLCNK